MKVVIVDGDLSYPPTSGKRIRTLHLMLRLARRHQITYLCRGNGDPQEARQATEFLGDHGIATRIIAHPLPRKSGPLFYARLAANLLSPLPYSVASHNCAAIRQAITAYADEHPVDLWQFEWMPYADALRNRPDARRVLIAHNVDSLIWQRYAENEKNALKRWYFRQQGRKLERYERQVYAQFDRVIAVSPDDAALAERLYGLHNTCVVENGIDRAYFTATPGPREPHRILFLGALDYRPNRDAVDLLLERVFPQVRAQVPSAQLCLVGRNPPAALVQRVAALPNVELHANVADVRPHLGRSGVMAVPLRIGGGSRLKILEALACGLPVVSTRIGAEGLALVPGRDLVVVEDVEQMAGALVEALRAPEQAQALAEHGRRVVLAHYDWDVLADKLEQVWEECQPSTSPGGAAFNSQARESLVGRPRA